MATQALFDFARVESEPEPLRAEQPRRSAPAPESSPPEPESSCPPTLAELRAKIDRWNVRGQAPGNVRGQASGAVRGQAPGAVRQPSGFSTGCADLDRWLPAGGLRVDGVTEWVAGTLRGSGALTFAFAAASSLLTRPAGGEGPPPGPVVVADPEGTFYPPAAVSLGIAPERIVWCRTKSSSDTVWTIDQALRCRSVAAVVAVIGHRLDDRDARRFQLSAEAGRTPALLVRRPADRGLPSFAEHRFHVVSRKKTPVPFSRAFRVTLDRCRGGVAPRSMAVGIDDSFDLRMISESRHEKAALHLASQLAGPKTSHPARSRTA